MFDLSPPQDDGLCIPEVPEHSKYKHHFVRRYMDVFTIAMKNKNWAGLHYIDLFAGAGIEKLRTSHQLDWGSPMMAAKVPHPFTKLHLCEDDPEKYSALKTRINQARPDSQVLHGDAKEKILDIIGNIPDRTLSLAFLDPYGLHLSLDTLKILAQKRTDLIVFFPDRLDALRNWAAYYLDNPDSNLDRCLGSTANWRSRLNETPSDQHAQILRDMYIEQMQKELGYTNFDFERISTVRGQPLYYLIFCSHSEIGAHLWRKIAVKKPNGQRTFEY